MKHCPQCEFTFDDQQQICDFDGSELRVIPEAPLPSFKNASLAPAAPRAFFRNLIQSRVGLAVLALTGLVLSALLIGYFDSANQANVDESTSLIQKDTASLVPATSVETAGQTESRVTRSRIISTQRKVGANELPSSTVKRLRQGSRSQSAKSGRSPVTNKQVVTKRGPSRSRFIATKRGRSRSRLVAIKRKAENANRRSQARNQSRPNSAQRDRRQHTAASVATRRPGWSANERTIESAPQRKDRKVIAILKKTGSILKRPFEFIAGR